MGTPGFAPPETFCTLSDVNDVYNLAKTIVMILFGIKEGTEILVRPLVTTSQLNGRLKVELDDNIRQIIEKWFRHLCVLFISSKFLVISFQYFAAKNFLKMNLFEDRMARWSCKSYRKPQASPGKLLKEMQPFGSCKLLQKFRTHWTG